MAPSISTGLRSLSGPSVGDSRTIAVGEEAVARPLPGTTQRLENGRPAERVQEIEGDGGGGRNKQTDTAGDALPFLSRH